MKILGLTNANYTDGYIAAVSAQEMGYILHGRYHPVSNLKEGSEITIGTHWQRVIGIETAQSTLNNHAKALRAMADMLEHLDVVIPPPKEEEKT